MRSRRLAAAPLCLLFLGLVLALPSCQFLYPEPDFSDVEEKDKEGPNFDDDPAIYAKNAKEYFQGGDYGRARQQWSQQIKLEPDQWYSRLGIAYCDYFIGRQATVRNDLGFGETRLRLAEREFRELWDGEIPATTEEEPGQPESPWRAAMGLAMTLRGLGSLHGIMADLQKQRLATLALDDDDRAEIRKEYRQRSQWRRRNYEAAIDLFEKLAAMDKASPEAINHLAGLYVVTGRDDAAEKHYLRYLSMADATYVAHLERKENLDEEFKILESLQDATRFIDQKLESNKERRVGVLVDLSALHWGKQQYGKAVKYLEKARQIQPERLDILVKLAQCQGELGYYKSALQNLDDFIAGSSRTRERFSENIGRAYRLRREYQMKLDEGK